MTPPPDPCPCESCRVLRAWGEARANRRRGACVGYDYVMTRAGIMLRAEVDAAALADSLAAGREGAETVRLDASGHGRVVCDGCGAVVLSCRCFDCNGANSHVPYCPACCGDGRAR